MRKITNLFLLCALMLIGVVSAKAQKAVDYQVSEAPTNGKFAENTHWYTMKFSKAYVSTENVASSTSYLLSSNNFQILDHTIDKGLWCIVGNNTKGYKFYNKSEGATKVLALSYNSGNTGGAAKAKMVDASLGNATTAGDNQWLTTFDIYKNTNKNVGAFSISVKGLTNYYINSRDGYVSFWINGDAKQNNGSSFYFYDVASYATSTVNEAQTLLTTFTGHVGGLFQPTQAELDDYQTSIQDLNIDNITWDNLQTSLSTINTKVSTFKSQIDQHKPIVGQKYAIKNNHTGKYITPNVRPGDNLYVYKGDKVKASVWIVENGDSEGTLKLKNAYSQLYASNTTVNTDASSLYIISNGYNSDGDAAIGTTSNLNSSTWYHANNDDHVIPFIKNAGASRWIFEPVSDEDYNALANNIDVHINTLVNSPADIFTVATNEKATLKANPTYENYLAYKQKAKEGNDNQYIRLQCAKNGNNCFLGLNDSYTVGRSLEASTQKTNLSNIWKLVPVDGSTLYKLMNANTGTYLTGLTNATAGQNNNAPTLSDFAHGHSFTFSIKDENHGNYDVIDENGNKLNAETVQKGSCINYWTDNGNAGWYILKATDIQVALHELGDASYASLYLPYSISAVDGATAYVAETEATDNTLVVKSTEDGGFAANAGVVLVNDKKAATATLTLGENSNTSVLSGTNAPVSVTDDKRTNYLVFGPKDGATNTVGFWSPAPTLTTIPANRAYYQAPSGQAVALVFGGNTTDINNALANKNDATNTNAPMFDLSGRRVANAIKGGVYIQNGKKYIVK